MAVTRAAQRRVLGLARRIKLNGDTRPVAHNVSKPVTSGLPSDDSAALAGLLGEDAPTEAPESYKEKLASPPKLSHVTIEIQRFPDTHFLPA